MLRYLLPLGLFIGLVTLFIFGLNNDPRHVPSPLVNKPAPEFTLPTLHDPDINIGLADLKGQVSLINVWASWCMACRTEHPVLVKASDTMQLNLYGLNYKDKREDALNWLKEFHNPYKQSAFDDTGKVGIDYGVYGVPETFVLDKQGIIRYKHIGPLSEEQLETIIIPIITEIEATQS